MVEAGGWRVSYNRPIHKLEVSVHMHTPVSELAEPDEGLRVLHLLLDQLGHHVTCMDIDGTDGHDLLAVPLGQLTKQVGDQSVQLGHLVCVHAETSITLLRGQLPNVHCFDINGALVHL